MTAPASGKMVSIQMLRGVAILLVLFFHLTEAERRYVGVARQIEYSGVRGFFSFAYDRATRIYPIYWLYSLVLI